MRGFTSAGGMPAQCWGVDIFSVLLLGVVASYYAFVFYHVFKPHPSAVRRQKSNSSCQEKVKP